MDIQYSFGNEVSCYASVSYTHLEAVGLDPYVGYLHTERPGRVSLALDLIEEFRAVYADRFVVSLINKKICLLYTSSTGFPDELKYI